MRIDTELITYLCNSMVPRAGKAREATEWDEEIEEVDENWMLIEASS